MWQDSLFSFDASALLNVYGYSEETRQELLTLLETLPPRVCLPHQFGLEFVRNRVKVILKQVRNYQNVEKHLDKLKEENFKPRREHPFLSPKSLKAYESLCTELASDREKMERLITNDPFADRICKIFEGRLGDLPSEEELAKLHQEAKARYDKSTPPGYKDLDKGIPDAFGDYIGWYQLIKIAKKAKKGVIFICDDAKEDWWHIQNERTIGPRYEIIAEFQSETQQQFYMYSSDNFLRSAKAYLNQDIKENAIDEVSERLASNTEIERAGSLKPAVEPAGSAPESLKPVVVVEETAGSDLKPAPPVSNDVDLKPKTGS